MAIRKIVSRSIGTDVIAAEDLANNSVTVAEITDGAVTSAKMNGLTGSSSGIIQADGDGTLSTTTVDLTSRVEVAGDTMTGALEIDISGDGNGALKLNAGDDSNGSLARAQIKLGYNGTQDYAHFITTRHNGGAEDDNAISFSVSDGTQSAVLGTDTKEVLRLDGTGAVYKPNNPIIRVTKSGITHSGGDGATTEHFFASSGRYETSRGGWTYDGSNRLIVPADGLYEIFVIADLVINNGGYNIRAAAARLRINGATQQQNMDNWFNWTSGYTSNHHYSLFTPYLLDLAAGDALNVVTQVYHNSSSVSEGGNVTIQAKLVG